MTHLPKVALALGLTCFGATTLAAGPNAADRGAYLVATGGCSDCHTPMKMTPTGPAPDRSRGLSGHPEDVKLPPPPAASGPWLWGGAATNTAFWGPWGISYAINLTPDKSTGIGSWKSDDFVKAIKTGKHLGTGRPILPPMPWPAMSNLTDADLRLMFDYLMKQPAVKNAVPDAVVAAR